MYNISQICLVNKVRQEQVNIIIIFIITYHLYTSFHKQSHTNNPFVTVSISSIFGKLKHNLKLSRIQPSSLQTMNTFKTSKPLSFRQYENIKFVSQGGPRPIFVHSWQQVAYYDDSRVVLFIIVTFCSLVSTHLEADTERERKCDDDDKPGDGCQQPATHPDTGLGLVTRHSPHGRLLLAVDTDCAYMGASLPILVTSIGVHLNNNTVTPSQSQNMLASFV